MNEKTPSTAPRVVILPSLLAADLASLGDEIMRAEASGADALHIDVMDPHFVPNMSFGPDVVALARKTAPGFYRNVHLMMSRPDLYIEKFVEAGAQTVQVHVEADCDIHAALARIRSFGARCALVFNPETPVSRIYPYLKEADEFLAMTVHPGFGGQSFITECLPKIAELRKLAPSADIMIDGGVNARTAPLAAAHGANMFVAGSYLFAQSGMAGAVASLRASCEAAREGGAA